MHFTKMHGLGNDFIILNAFKHIMPDDLSAFAQKACNRRFGVGADGILILSPSDQADVDFKIYNADGSQAEMCGNGIRCAAAYLYKKGICAKDEIRFSTLAGEVITRFANEDRDMVIVNMGQPRLAPADIPADFYGSRVISAPLLIGSKSFSVTLVSMGNPHCVIFVKDLESFPVAKYGPLIEKDFHFPAKTNVEFVEFQNEHNIQMRVWERGCGITQACGTGACAAGVAANLNGFCERNLNVHLDGGILNISWHEDNSVEMTGPAAFVFKGEI